MVHASYQSHLGEDALFAPASRLNDGTIWLLIIRGNVTRSQLLHFLLGLSTAAHVQNTGNGIDFVPVRAFRIEPDMEEKGYITVDGEHVEYGPIQAEVFPGLARILVPWYPPDTPGVDERDVNEEGFDPRVVVLSTMDPVLIRLDSI